MSLICSNLSFTNILSVMFVTRHIPNHLLLYSSMLDPALPHPPHLLTSFPPLPLFLISSTLLLVSTATSNKAFCFRSSMVKVDLFHDFNAEDLCFLSIFSSLGGDEMCQRGERVMVALLSVEC